MKSRIIVSAIIERDGKYLFGKKPKDVGPYPNTYHLLGGGVNAEEESLEEGLIREIKEEAGIGLTHITRLSFDEGYATNKHGEEVHYLFHVYTATYANGEEKPGDDIAELVWLTKEDIKKVPLPEPSEKLFKELGWR